MTLITAQAPVNIRLHVDSQLLKFNVLGAGNMGGVRIYVSLTFPTWKLLWGLPHMQWLSLSLAGIMKLQ